ncbi:MAG: hypothetical protein KBT02_11735 [Treponema sp.]|nr:hypothetical protein [Candidatus Treponema caballi]
MPIFEDKYFKDYVDGLPDATEKDLSAGNNMPIVSDSEVKKMGGENVAKVSEVLYINEDLYGTEKQCKDEAINQGFIRANGTIKVDENWRYSNKIKLGRSKLSVTLYGFRSAVRSLEFFDSADNVVGYYIHDGEGMFTIKDVEIPDGADTFRFATQVSIPTSVSESSVVLHFRGEFVDIPSRVSGLEGYGTKKQCKDAAINQGFIRANGIIQVDENWKFSDKIEIDTKKLSVSLFGHKSVRSVEFFDAENNVVGYYIHNINDRMFTIADVEIPEDAKYFRFSTQTTNEQSIRESSVVLVTEGVKSVSARVSALEESTKSVRENVYILKTDSELVIADKMFYAYNKGNCDVHWENGSYEFREVFDYIHENYDGNNHNELPIGGNCRYFFNGSTLTGYKTSTDEVVIGNSSILGSQRKGGSYELHDGKLVSYGLVYCVHDECTGSLEESRRIYKNMVMDSTPDYDTYATLSKCIGGGTGCNHVVTIYNCIFNNHSRLNRPDVSYHGHTSYNVIDLVSRFSLNVFNSFFEHYISLNTLGNNEDALAAVNNCSLGSYVDNGIEVTDSRWQVQNFMNEIRNV